MSEDKTPSKGSDELREGLREAAAADTPGYTSRSTEQDAAIVGLKRSIWGLQQSQEWQFLQRDRSAMKLLIGLDTVLEVTETHNSDVGAYLRKSAAEFKERGEAGPAYAYVTCVGLEALANAIDCNLHEESEVGMQAFLENYPSLLRGNVPESRRALLATPTRQVIDAVQTWHSENPLAGNPAEAIRDIRLQTMELAGLQQESFDDPNAFSSALAIAMAHEGQKAD